MTTRESTGGILLQDIDVDGVLLRSELARGLERYQWLQRQYHVNAVDVSTDVNFQRQFNGFYRVRRGQSWREHFFELLQAQRHSRQSFHEVVARIHKHEGTYESSFASKLVATVDPTQPVIDRHVLSNAGIRPPSRQTSKLEDWTAVHELLKTLYANTLSENVGRSLVRKFDAAFPSASITDVKKLDLVLWQTRRRP